MSSTVYIFADLDALNQDVGKYMRAHSSEFSDAELGKHFPLSAHKLTKLLSNSDGATKYFQGSYYHLKLKDVEAFRAAGWDMRPKSASKNRTLGHLPKPKRNFGDDEGESKTLVLLAGKVAASVLHGVDKYFDAGWCVKCYCFRDRDAKIYDRRAAAYPSHFQCIYLDKSVRSLIKDVSADSEILGSSTPLKYKLPRLYQQIHELQEKVLAMEAKSAAQSIMHYDNIHVQLHQQKDAFKYQLRKQDEEFEKRLRAHRKAATFLQKRHEQLVEERVEECSIDVATALSNVRELSERVKQDVVEYQRYRLDEELVRWRRGNHAQTSSFNFQDTPVGSTLLDAVDAVLKHNGVANGIKNWRAALVMLIAHKLTAWLSSASFGTDFVGAIGTAMAIMVIAGCFVG